MELAKVVWEIQTEMAADEKNLALHFLQVKYLCFHPASLLP
jgi:hypothetical protein